MKVKRLELQGFKSFKDRTVIHFDDGVTGIVGPNGCGKSNIVDSFFWVMGEQSTKHLRGSTSLDLIFSGSQKYAPGGLAEVTMVLDTEAPKESELEGQSLRDLPAHMRYQEISITRRLYRDGETEYLINGQTCRLKDIHELFMDTGAGPKAYSIIEQGQISKIVASKPEDRRVLVEEAAGITKFKARKKESLRKIEATQANLARVNDIVTEIERQLASLERQATKARQYKKYKEELKENELLVGRKRLFTLKTRMANLGGRIDGLSTDETARRNELAGAELRIESLKIEESEATRQADDSLTALQTLQRELSSLQTTLELHKRSIQEAHSASESLEGEKQALEERIATVRESTALLNDESAQLKGVFENADGILRDHQNRLDEARAQADTLGKALEAEKHEMMAAFTRQNEISNQVHGLEARVDALSVRLNQLASRISDRELDEEVLKEKETSARDAFETNRVRRDDVNTRLTAVRERVTSLDAELKELRVNEGAARRERTEIESRVKALQQLVDNHEGLAADVRKILADPSFSQGLSGAFADHLEAHPGYEYALESALRDFLEAIFVEDATRAQDILGRLKDENLGRATFWSLDMVRAKAAACAEQASRFDAAGLPGTALSDVIRLSHPAAEQILPLFRRYRVVDELSEAMAASQATAVLDAVFVTRSGDVVDALGRVSGGSTKALAGGILARKAELTQLSERLIAVVANHDALEARLTQVEQELHAGRQEQETLSSESRELEIVTKSAEKDLSAFSIQLEQLRKELLSEREERSSADEERRGLWEKLDAIRQELNAFEAASKARQSGIDEKTAAFNKAMETCAELQAGLIQLKVDFTSAQEKHRFAQEKLANLDREYKSTSARLDEVKRIMGLKHDEKDNLQAELMELEEKLQGQLDRVQSCEERLRSHKDTLERSRAQLSETMNAQRVALKAVEEASAELGRCRLEHERAGIEFQAMLTALFERYGLEESSIAHDPAFDDISEEDEKRMLEEVEHLREKIRRMGEVNVMAVEEYDEQKKRHDFLSVQRDDLLKSIRDLELAIERINKTSQERFARAFDEINKRFTQIFPLVFGGGSARLELTNPEDINETGVEIFAEPPGKKMGSIQLMSGGEKALTAVALIFSIFLIKPSPFCVLDEVDAPLDDHNVGKFNMLLQEMAARTQFIIITHNKRTMELNNKLYGVTMEEPGVSKMVSIEVR